MLRNPNRLTKTQPTAVSCNEEKKARFRIEKLEERIAPKGCHYNPHGKFVGCGFLHKG